MISPKIKKAGKFLVFLHTLAKKKEQNFFYRSVGFFFLPSQWQCCYGQVFLEWQPHFQIESQRISESWRVPKRSPLEWHTKGWPFSINAGKCWRNCSNWRDYKLLETFQRPRPWWSKLKHTWPCCEIGRRSIQKVIRGVDCKSEFWKVKSLSIPTSGFRLKSSGFCLVRMKTVFLNQFSFFAVQSINFYRK